MKEERRTADVFGESITADKKLDSAMILLEQRKDFLEGAVRAKEKTLKKAPEGTLRINKADDRVQYYQRTDPKDKCGLYIPNNNVKLAQQLAQKAEDQKEIIVMKQEITHIKKFIDKYPPRAESVYEGLSEERKKLVLPLEESDEEFVRRWRAQEFVPHPVPPSDPGLVTERGETVRSRAELIIANMANQLMVPYFYEKPLYLEGLGTVYTDLLALNVRLRKEILIEYLGMMHDPEYAARAVERINAYIRSGFYPGENLILIFEAEGSPLDTRLVRTLLERYCL